MDFRSVPSGPLHGVNPIRAAGSLVRMARGVVVALGVMREFAPDALMMTGGWATFPVALAAWLRRVPILIFVPDIEPGATIRALSRLATRLRWRRTTLRVEGDAASCLAELPIHLFLMRPMRSRCCQQTTIIKKR